MSDAPLRILQVYPKSDYFTGAAIQLRELAYGLKARGHEVVVATRASDVWAAKTAEGGIPYYPLPMSSEVDLGSARRLARIIRKHRVQIVHAQKGRARTLALVAGLFVRLPVLVLNRGVSFPVDGVRRLGYTTRRVRAIVAVSEAVKRGLVAAGVAPEKIEVIYSGTDTTRFHPGVDGRPVRRELGLEDRHFLVAQIGARSTKGNDDLIDAMGMLAPRFPHARLLVVGVRRPEPLFARVQARGLLGRVHLVGYREDVPQVLAASDCCVDASHSGVGLAGALRESLAVETPVVAADVAGNPELVTHGETGLLVPPRDPAALAAGIAWMMENPEARAAMARRGRARVELRFSTRAKVEATEALYRRLVGAGS